MSLPEVSQANIAEIDRLIHEPARMQIMAYLYLLDEADFLFLKHETGLTHGNLSSHLSKLEEAGYVTVEKTFSNRKPRTVLSLTPSGRDAVKTYKERMQQVLDSLED